MALLNISSYVFFRIAAEHEQLAELEKKERELAKEQRLTYL